VRLRGCDRKKSSWREKQKNASKLDSFSSLLSKNSSLVLIYKRAGTPSKTPEGNQSSASPSPATSLRQTTSLIVVTHLPWTALRPSPGARSKSLYSSGTPTKSNVARKISP
jgi:hypothetical protein